MLSQLDNKSLVQSVINSEFNNSSFSPVVGNNFLIPVSAVYSDSVEGSIDIKGLRYPLVIGQNILPWTHSTKLSIQLSGKTLRFAGLGINAKEASWNDYGVRDVKNDVVIIQAGDPGHYDPKITAFNGEYQGYYSRWQYKVEEAKRRGAAGVFLVPHQTKSGLNSWGYAVEQWELGQKQLSENGMEFVAWLHPDVVRNIFAISGLRYSRWLNRLGRRATICFKLDSLASIDIVNTIKTMSENIFIARKSGKMDENILIILRDTEDSNKLQHSIWLLMARLAHSLGQTDRGFIFVRVPSSDDRGLMMRTLLNTKQLSNVVGAISVEIAGNHPNLALGYYGKNTFSTVLKEYMNQNVVSTLELQELFDSHSSLRQVAMKGIPTIAISPNANAVNEYGRDSVTAMLKLVADFSNKNNSVDWFLSQPFARYK